MHAAIADIRCEIEQMIVAGQAIDFIGTDIYRIADGRIAENWHIEDNLTLMQHLGLVTK